MYRSILLLAALFVLAACTPGVKQRTELVTDPGPPTPRGEVPLWSRLAAKAPPERLQVRERYRYGRELRATGVEGVTSLICPAGSRDDLVGFALTNRGSSRINPRGLGSAPAMRDYRFLFPDRAREDIHLTVSDDVAVSGRYSHDNMFRELHFFPRLQIPSVERAGNGERLEVTLPTGEPVVFDASSKEIVDGVLREQPMDVSPDRHARTNPGLSYLGNGLMITVAQRGEAPRRARVWGQTKHAEVHYPARYREVCRVSPALIWDQNPEPGDSDPRLTMLHPSDQGLFRTVEEACGWDLQALMNPKKPAHGLPGTMVGLGGPDPGPGAGR